MKKKAIILLLTSAVLTSAMAGCGCGSGNADDNTNDNGANITGTEEITANDTETVFDTENATSQLQLGNAVEIPQGWEGQLAETNAYGELERVIADYCGIAQENYANVRYYYNYVDLNGDSKNEILALVLGENVTEVEGNVLLWIDDAENGNITKDSVKQAFHQVEAPVYISNHMTDGYRDLIVSSYTGTDDTAENTADTNANGTAANEADTNGAAANARTTESDTSNGNATKQGTTPADGVTQNTGNQTGTANQTTGNNQTIGNTAAGVGYRLLVWNGERYQTLEEGTVLENLDNYEGTAILTNNMENDLANDNYHFLGEALK